MKMETTSCKRCGTCCRKGGPTLHEQDVVLFEKEIINPEQVYTIRKGERVMNPVDGAAEPQLLMKEIVKIRNKEGFSVCMLYGGPEQGCTIYESRPAECRAFKCWDPEELKAMYEKDRLERSHIVDSESKLAELMEVYEDRLGLPYVEKILNDFIQASQNNGQIEEPEKELLDAVRFDTAFRGTVKDNLQCSERLLDFLFGRQLVLLLDSLGVQVIRENDTLKLKMNA